MLYFSLLHFLYIYIYIEGMEVLEDLKLPSSSFVAINLLRKIRVKKN